MTLTFELQLDNIKLNQHVKYLGQKSFRSKVIVRTHSVSKLDHVIAHTQ